MITGTGGSHTDIGKYSCPVISNSRQVTSQKSQDKSYEALLCANEDNQAVCWRVALLESSWRLGGWREESRECLEYDEVVRDLRDSVTVGDLAALPHHPSLPASQTRGLTR